MDPGRRGGGEKRGPGGRRGSGAVEAGRARLRSSSRWASPACSASGRSAGSSIRSGRCRRRSNPSRPATTRRRCPSRRQRMKPACWPVRLTCSNKVPRRWTSSAGSRPTPRNSRASCRARHRSPNSVSGLFRGLVPVLGGGVAGFYLFENDPERSGGLRAMGSRKAEPRGFVPPRRGTGRPVRARAQAGHSDESAAGLSPRSPRGWAEPRRPRRWRGRCVSGHVAGVLEIASFRALRRTSRRCSRNCCRWSR